MWCREEAIPTSWMISGMRYNNNNNNNNNDSNNNNTSPSETGEENKLQPGQGLDLTKSLATQV